MTTLAVDRSALLLVTLLADLVCRYFEVRCLLAVMTAVTGAGEDAIVMARLAFRPEPGMRGVRIGDIPGSGLEPYLDRAAVGQHGATK
ncbi:MAG: hypothetical protein C0615_09370 [Desulfuromonas sp.]|nr:MAG: hypothetical protein C0615_09370 [Desulfuromonas sp.]